MMVITIDIWFLSQTHPSWNWRIKQLLKRIGTRENQWFHLIDLIYAKKEPRKQNITHFNSYNDCLIFQANIIDEMKEEAKEEKEVIGAEYCCSPRKKHNSQCIQIDMMKMHSFPLFSLPLLEQHFSVHRFFHSCLLFIPWLDEYLSFCLLHLPVSNENEKSNILFLIKYCLTVGLRTEMETRDFCIEDEILHSIWHRYYYIERHLSSLCHLVKFCSLMVPSDWLISYNMYINIDYYPHHHIINQSHSLWSFQFSTIPMITTNHYRMPLLLLVKKCETWSLYY